MNRIFSKGDMFKPRRCQVTKTSDYNGYGFRLSKSRAGVVKISDVESDSPASIAGLGNDDILLRINHMVVLDKTYDQIVEILKKASEGNVILLEVINSDICKGQVNRLASLFSEPDVLHI